MKVGTRSLVCLAATLLLIGGGSPAFAEPNTKAMIAQCGAEHGDDYAKQIDCIQKAIEGFAAYDPTFEASKLPEIEAFCMDAVTFGGVLEFDAEKKAGAAKCTRKQLAARHFLRLIGGIND